ncbi:MAG: adenylate/guanylate cyclase domain-containing protein [Acidobacteria bacterium]|nr:adenylate/guanylate cyclase domain-containing protein [Acidobacteriota bacterium]
MTLRRRSALLIRLICAGTAVLWILLVVVNPSLLERFELAALDTELHLASASRASSDIVIVALDERAVHRYGPLRWPPALMAEVLTALDRVGARVIAFDFVFSGDGDRRAQAATPGPSRYLPLCEAVARSGKVVLGTYFDFESDPEDRPAPPDFREHRARSVRYLGGATPATAEAPVPLASEVHPLAPELAAVAHSFGHLNIVPSPGDGIMRWLPLVARYQNDFYTDFDVEVARTYLGNVRAELLLGRRRVEGVQLGPRRITTDERGQLLIRFAGGRGSYTTLSAADLLAARIPPEQLRDRIVLVGSTAAGAADVWATPLDPLLPGVEIHANAIDNLLHGNYLVRNWQTRLLTFVVLALLGLGGGLVLPWALGFGLRRLGALAAAVVAAGLVGHYLLFTRTGYAVGLVSPLLAMVTLLGGTLVASYFTEEKQRQQVERSFEHYLDRSVINELLERPERLRLGGERRELSVLFCDIRNFTSLAEGLPPEATVEMLNEFFTTMTGVIFSRRGLVDKFVGDQIMAVWGAPLERADHAAQACAAALEMTKAFGELKARWANLPVCAWDPARKESQAGPTTINCGVGINSGPMVVGNIGSARRISYTVIGDHVNVASRLESLNKLYGTQILVGPPTYVAAREEFRFREIDRLRVRGRTQAQVVYELLGRNHTPALDEDWLAAFAEGLETYRQQDWAAAARAFAAALDRNPFDACAKFYLSRAEHFAKNPPKEEREGALYLR